MKYQTLSHLNYFGLKQPTIKSNYVSIFPIAFLLLITMGTTAFSQIVPDDSLPNNSVTLPQENEIEITEGTTSGSNLFHSFEQFSLSTGETAWFNNALTIDNIITRITGNSISNIDGFIRANGTANLFLINPHGIVFGENAALDIGGSFVGSTANSIKFADGSEFSAINPQETPLLTVSIPIGLQSGTNNGDIVVEGSGNNLRLNPDFSIDKSDRPHGLKVKNGETLALVGNNINISGGNLTTPAGKIELWAVNNGSLSIADDDGKLQIEAPSESLTYGNIELSQAASVDTSSSSAGAIQLQGQNISIKDGSVILSNTLGTASGGNVNIKATELLQVKGISAQSPIFSSILADVTSGAMGEGGNILIETDSLQVTDGGQISSGTFGIGNAGTLTVNAKNIQISGGSPFGPSGLFTPVASGATGNGGNLTIETGSLEITDAGQISSGTFGFGNGGNLTIKANSISVSGGNQFAPSSLDTSVFKIPGIPEEIAIELGAGVGNGGNLIIETSSLLVIDGGQINVSTNGSGQAGNLAINAEKVELLGFNELGRSGLYANAFIQSGNGGNIDLQSDRLSLNNGATISVSNFASNPNIPPGTGIAGNININVDSLELDSFNPESISKITASANSQTGGNISLNINSDLALKNGSQITAETRGDGDGGNITLSADQLNLDNLGQVSVNSMGLGQAGNIQIAANKINTNQGKITATSTQAGGGNINLGTNFIFMENNSLVSTSVLDSSGGGGNLVIDSTYVVARDNSDLRANAVFGAGGNIDITTEVIFLSLDSDIDSSSQFGLDGVVEIRNPEANKQNGVIALPARITDPTDIATTKCLIDDDNSMTVVGRGGLSENPLEYLRSQSVWEDLRDLEQQTPTASNNEIVEAQSWFVNKKGNIELLSRLPFNRCKQ